MKIRTILFTIVIIISVCFLAHSIDRADVNAVSYNYNAAKTEMFCTNDNDDLIYDSVSVEKDMPKGSYTIYAHCDYCHQKYSITYNADSREIHKFLEY